MRKKKEWNRKILFLTALEILCIFFFALDCFKSCAHYQLNGSGLEALSGHSLVYFPDGSAGMEAAAQEAYDLMGASLELGSGAYCVKVEYDSASDYQNVNMDNCAGEIYFQTENSAVLRSDAISLCDGSHETQSRIWLRKTGGGVKM